MNSKNNKLCIGVLGMYDNESTWRLLEYLVRESCLKVDFVIYWKPCVKEQLKRIKRKIKLAGIAATIQRIYYALFISKRIRKDGVKYKKEYDEYFVASHNSSECIEILIDKNVDILLIATDAILSSEILNVPRLTTLNAHPGWIPQFRGLHSMFYQLKRGFLPSVSVHVVDEGIDTGPALLRESIEVDPHKGLDHIQKRVDLLQARLMAKAIRMFEDNKVCFIDTFQEVSNMTRGMPLNRIKILDNKLKFGELMLTNLNSK